MSEQLKRLKNSAKADEAKIHKMQEALKAKQERIRKMEDEELLRSLNAISAGNGMKAADVVAAIRNRDFETITLLMEEQDTPKSGTGSGEGE